MSNRKDVNERRPGQFTNIMEYQADVLNNKKVELTYDVKDVPEEVRELAKRLKDVAGQTFQYGWSLNDIAELSLAL
jgi:hypothetical protein